MKAMKPCYYMLTYILTAMVKNKNLLRHYNIVNKCETESTKDA